MVNNQQDAKYCGYCGSSLAQAQQNQRTPSFHPSNSQTTSYPVGGRSPYEASERYEKALRKVEQLGYAVLIMGIVVLVLILI